MLLTIESENGDTKVSVMLEEKSYLDQGVFYFFKSIDDHHMEKIYNVFPDSTELIVIKLELNDSSKYVFYGELPDDSDVLQEYLFRYTLIGCEANQSNLLKEVFENEQRLRKEVV